MMARSGETQSAARVFAEVSFKPHDAGGRHTMPIGDGYAPYLRSGLTREGLPVRLYNVPADSKFGQVVKVTIELSYYPIIDYGLLSAGIRIQLLEGPKVVADGICTSSIIPGSVGE